MRKLLLATAAALGASVGVASVADAQTASPAPGTVTVRLNGRFRFFAGFVNDRDADNNTAGSASGNVNAAGEGTLTGRNKQNSYGFGNYARLYPGFDGVASNGLKYGASLEIRQDTGGGAGGGIAGSVSSNSNRRAGLYFRREWGYIGTNELGTIRFGNSDQPSSLYMTGNFENFDSGGLNGDHPNFLSPATLMPWPFADVGNNYSTSKIVYLSPQLFGLDFGVSYEPNSGGNAFTSGCGPSGASSSGCDRLSSTPFNLESARRRNTVDALLRYRGTFGGFGIAATAGYITGGNVQDNQTGVAFNSSRTNGLPSRDNFDGLNIGDFGVALTYAGISVGGKYQFGRFNNSWGLVPKGLPDGEAFMGGASYTAGPVVVGAHYVNYKSAGDLGNAAEGRQRREYAIAAGATYSVAPGLALYASYLWNERKQNGFNFITGQGVSPTARGGNGFSNKVTASVFTLGTSFTW